MTGRRIGLDTPARRARLRHRPHPPGSRAGRRGPRSRHPAHHVEAHPLQRGGDPVPGPAPERRPVGDRSTTGRFATSNCGRFRATTPIAATAVRHELNFGGGVQVAAAQRETVDVSAVHFDGAGADEAALRGRLRLTEGDRFDFVRWRDDVDRLQEWYREQRHLEARVRPSRTTAADGTAVLTYRVTAGPETVLEVAGATLSAEPAEAPLDEVWADSVFDRFLLEEIAARGRRRPGAPQPDRRRRRGHRRRDLAGPQDRPRAGARRRAGVAAASCAGRARRPSRPTRSTRCCGPAG